MHTAQTCSHKTISNMKADQINWIIAKLDYLVVSNNIQVTVSTL